MKSMFGKASLLALLLAAATMSVGCKSTSSDRTDTHHHFYCFECGSYHHFNHFHYYYYSYDRRPAPAPASRTEINVAPLPSAPALPPPPSAPRSLRPLKQRDLPF